MANSIEFPDAGWIQVTKCRTTHRLYVLGPSWIYEWVPVPAITEGLLVLLEPLLGERGLVGRIQAALEVEWWLVPRGRLGGRNLTGVVVDGNEIGGRHHYTGAFVKSLDHGPSRFFLYEASHCTGMAYDDTSLFITISDFGEARIEVVDRWTHAPLRTIGTDGSGPGQLNVPRGLWIHAGLLFVADSYNHRVSVFTVQGDFVRSIGAGTRGRTADHFDFPHDVCVDGGVLYVADEGNARIQLFTVAGDTFLGTLGEGVLQAPRSVVVRDKRVYVTEHIGRVTVLATPTWATVGRSSEDGAPTGTLGSS